MANSSNDPQSDTDVNNAPAMAHSTPTPMISGFSNQPWNPFSNSLSYSLAIKLDRVNFLSWKFQVVPTTIGHDLNDLLFSNVKPLKFLTNGRLVDKVKSICDSLAIAGYVVSNEDLELQLLNGLGSEYDSVVSGITSSTESKSLEEI
uniref:Uncharacterized protein n=1 Tax=Cannabis sativa TaxID=3483 RepID=A0A803NTD2_CANSA